MYERKTSMILQELIDVLKDDVVIDVYDTTEHDWHRTLYEGNKDGCKGNVTMCKVVSVWDYEDGICIGVNNEFVRTDDMQWQRNLGNGEYEMYQIVWIGDDPYNYFAGGGTFNMSDFEEDIPCILETYGYGDMKNFVKIYGDCSNEVLAECVFETAWCDFDIHSFATEDEAMAYIDELMRG